MFIRMRPKQVREKKSGRVDEFWDVFNGLFEGQNKLGQGVYNSIYIAVGKIKYS